MNNIVRNTFVVERTYPNSPAQIFAAFADPVSRVRVRTPGRAHDDVLAVRCAYAEGQGVEHAVMVARAAGARVPRRGEARRATARIET